MDKVFISIVLIIFPILMYLVFSCYNSLGNKSIENNVFIITMLSSLYLSLKFNIDNKLLILCNIPILICYFKREWLLGILLSVITTIVSYYIYDLNIYVVFFKYFGYCITYLILYKRKEFNYLYFKISGIIQGFFISFEYFMETYDGIDKLLYLMLYVLIIYGISFFCLYLFKLADNINELHQMINKINEENKLKDSLFKLTHEIKNPIAVCKGYLEMIDLKDLNKSSKYINIIKSEIDRSLNVMSDFMEYSKIKINKEIFDMVMLLDDIYESFNILAKDKHIKLNYNSKYDEIYLWGDYDRLKQVFVNIIKNSIESIENSGIISIDIKLEDKFVNVIFTDNGIGMNENDLDNIKEMFYTTKKNGTGLGVALSNEIVLAHNGRLEYDSEEGIGTKCTVVLPL